MATEIRCDQCSGPNAFRVYASVATAGGDKVKDYKFPECDCDLCKPCFERLMTVMRGAWPQRSKT